MKRQANALTAVLENWQDVENAIDIYANSAGSSLRENEIYLDSWEAKSKAVSAAWNELVNSLINSDWIKGFLDIAQGVLSWLTETNALVPILIGFIAGGLTSAIKGLIVWIQTLIAEGGALNVVFGGLPIIIGLITTLAAGLVTWSINASDTAKQIENLTNKIEEQQKAIDDLNAKEKEATDLYKEYASLMSKSNAYGLSLEEKESLLKISSDLVDTYGLEVQGIDAVTGAYIIGAEAINKYVDALDNERKKELEKQTDTRNDRIDKNIDKIKGSTARYDVEQVKKDIGKYINQNNKEETTSNAYGGTGMGVFANANKPSTTKDSSPNYLKDIDNPVVKRLLKQTELSPEDVSELESSLTKDAVVYSSVVSNIVKDLITNIQVDNADMLDSSGESLLTQLLTPYLTTIDWKNFKQDEFETKVKEFATQAASRLSEVATKLQDAQKKITSGEMNLSGYEDMYDTLQNKAGLLKQMLDQEIIDPKSYEEQVSQIYSQVANNIGLSMVEVAGKISETDKQSQQNFKNVADSFVALENQFRQGKISSVEYLTSITETIENMDFTKTFGKNTEAAQQFFSTLANKSANILQDTITQFESGKMSVKDYGDNLKNFAKQQKELAKNAIEEAKALGMSEDAVKELTDEYDKNSKAIDDAVKKWEELDGINAYLDDNIETLRTATNVASEAYQSFATGLYNEFTKLSDNMQSQIISDMQKMEGLGHITAENLKDEMAKSTSASAGLASAVASNTNDVFKNLANNGGKVLTALGNAIKNFKYTITFNPNAKFSGGEFNLIKWAKTGGQEGIKLPSISWDITGKAGGGAEGLGEALSGLGQSLSVASDFLDISDYGGGSGGGGNGNGNGGGSSGGGKGSGGSDKNKPDYEDPTDAIINRINLRSKELEQQEESIQNAIEIAELENDYKKQISSTNDLIATRKKRVNELKIANAGLHAEAQKLRDANTWNEDSWFDSQGNATEAYYEVYNTASSKEEQEKIKDLFDSLSKFKKAWTDNAKEIADLNKEILQDEKDLVDLRFEHSQNWIDERNTWNDWKLFDDNEIRAWERVVKWLKEDYPNAIDKIKEAEENLFEARKEQFSKSTDLASSYINSQRELLESHYNVENSIAEAQHEINKELKASKTMYEYLNEETRKLLFNQEDYNILSSKLVDIQDEALRLKADYEYALENSTLDTIEEITSNYQMQYETLMKSYEIAKADLEIAKKKQKLNNVLNERNVRMFINGSWQWVADTQNVIDAQGELADAEYAKNIAEAETNQTESLNNLTAQTDELGTIINLFESGVIDLDTAIYRATQAIEELPSAIASMFSTIGTNKTPSREDYSNVDYDPSVDYMSKIKNASTLAEALAYNKQRNAKIAGEGRSEGMLSDLELRRLFYNHHASGTRYTPGGLTSLGEYKDELFINNNGHLIPINQPTFGNIGAGGVVFNQEQMANLRSLWDLSNLSRLPQYDMSQSNKSRVETNYDNRIIINGMTVDTGSSDGQALVSALKRYIGNH